METQMSRRWFVLKILVLHNEYLAKYVYEIRFH